MNINPYRMEWFLGVSHECLVLQSQFCYSHVDQLTLLDREWRNVAIAEVQMGHDETSVWGGSTCLLPHPRSPYCGLLCRYRG